MVLRRTRNRDIALTTLIDLLVQVVFVFTLILIASEAIGGSPVERGWVTPEIWKTLINIFDIDPSRIGNINQQAEEMLTKYQDLKAEVERTTSELEKSRTRLTEMEGKLAELEKRTGRGPGNPPCKDNDNKEIVAISALIDSDGNITVIPLGDAAELRIERPLREGAFQTPVSADSFTTRFLPWREHGLERDPRCAYKAVVSYDPRAQAGKYEPARRAITRYFSLSSAPKPVVP